MKVNPLIIVGAIIGAVSIGFIVAYSLIKNKKEALGFERNMSDSEITRRLWRYAKPYALNFVAVLAIMIVSISYDIISPLLVGDIEEMIKGDFELKDLIIKVCVYASILIVSLCATYLQSIILQKTGQKILSNIRQELFEHIESLSHGQLSKIPIGTLVTRETNDTNAISMMFTNVIVHLIKNCFVIIGVFTAMLCLNYMLSLMILCFVPFIILFTVIFRKFARRAYRQVKNKTTAINTFLSENLSGMKTIQVFNRESAKNKEFLNKNDQLRKSKDGQMFVNGIFRPTVYMLYMSSILCLFWLGGKGYLDGYKILGQSITGGVIVSFYMFISKFFNPIQNLAEQFNWLQSAYASAEKIFTLFDLKSDVVDTEGAVDVDEIKGDIEFRNVWFAYNEGEWVLKNVSFKINAGQTVAFVGSTGSGKSTILSLICRNYEIQKGQILIDGRDIREIKISSLRSHFGQMLQDVFLFSGTVRSNILLHKEGVSDEKILSACKYVNADKLINKLPKGLDEEVGERGNNFSAGERQLLSFARMIVHHPDVMILDEATANIDTETEMLIQDSLEKMMKIGTLIIVAHRLSTVKKADNIIVLSHGEVIEQGNHDTLIEKKGKYYELYKLQEDRKMLKNSEISV